MGNCIQGTSPKPAKAISKHPDPYHSKRIQSLPPYPSIEDVLEENNHPDPSSRHVHIIVTT